MVDLRYMSWSPDSPTASARWTEMEYVHRKHLACTKGTQVQELPRYAFWEHEDKKDMYTVNDPVTGIPAGWTVPRKRRYIRIHEWKNDSLLLRLIWESIVRWKMRRTWEKRACNKCQPSVPSVTCKSPLNVSLRHKPIHWSSRRFYVSHRGGHALCSHPAAQERMLLDKPCSYGGTEQCMKVSQSHAVFYRRISGCALFLHAAHSSKTPRRQSLVFLTEASYNTLIAGTLSACFVRRNISGMFWTNQGSSDELILFFLCAMS